MRNKLVSAITACLCVAVFAVSANAEINIIPKPMHVKQGQGEFKIKPDTVIVVDRKTKQVGEYLAAILRKSTGYRLPVKSSAAGSGIIIWSGGDDNLGKEGYELSVTKDSAVIVSPTAHGAFYGVQSLRQLLPVEIESSKVVKNVEWTAPVCNIKDKPRFSWRGIHLDVGRHYFSVKDIKKFIDLLAMQKINKFHWHLTEDQGWRIEIKKYPKLTSIGSKRASTPVKGNRKKLDGKEYGGFYTQKEVKEIVAYAAKRFITVIPEIDIPGHTQAVLAAYPELGCTGGPYKTRCFWGISKEVLCAGNPKSYKVIKDVFDEVIKLFPSKVIHIGGDECWKHRWKKCKKCQAMIKKLGIKDEHELQSHFIKEIEKHLNSKGRVIIGWDEILEGGLAPNAMVMSWRGTKGGIKAANMEHYVVMSPQSHCYFDYYQSGKPWTEPEAIGGHLPLRRVYSFEPIPAKLPEAKWKYILGVQGNVWTEYISTFKKVEYMTFPRANALAEVAWSPRHSKNYKDFLRRLAPMLKRYKLMGVNYRTPKSDDHKKYKRPRKNNPAKKNQPIKLIRNVNFAHNIGVKGRQIPGFVFDGKVNTYFMSKKAPKAGDTFTVTLKKPEEFKMIKLLSGRGRNDKFAINGAVVEVSYDGKTYHLVGEVEQSGYLGEYLPQKPIKSIRIRFLEDQKNPIMIRELIVQK